MTTTVSRNPICLFKEKKKERKRKKEREKEREREREEITKYSKFLFLNF
jgi:hypothetical protein